MVSQGWICPRCGKVHGMSSTQCDCVPASVASSSLFIDSAVDNDSSPDYLEELIPGSEFSLYEHNKKTKLISIGIDQEGGCDFVAEVYPPLPGVGTQILFDYDTVRVEPVRIGDKDPGDPKKEVEPVDDAPTRVKDLRVGDNFKCDARGGLVTYKLCKCPIEPNGYYYACSISPEILMHFDGNEIVRRVGGGEG